VDEDDVVSGSSHPDPDGWDVVNDVRRMQRIDALNVIAVEVAAEPRPPPLEEATALLNAVDNYSVENNRASVELNNQWRMFLGCIAVDDDGIFDGAVADGSYL
jgi:hypothetical protein